MSKPQAQKAAAPPPAEEAHPLVLIGLEKTPKGLVPVSVVVQGDRVVSKEKHGPPELMRFAAGKLRRLLTQKVLTPGR
jgi:hypothetical protein